MTEPLPAADFVYVPVPRDRVLDVMRLLALASASTDSPQDDEPAAPVAPSRRAPPEREPQPASDGEKRAERSAGWDPGELRELVELCPNKQLLVLQLLAERAGEWVTAWELREFLVTNRDISEINTERSGRALGAVMSALRKRSNWYDRKPPFESTWNETRWENVYRMPRKYAEPILAAVREHRSHHMGATG